MSKPDDNLISFTGDAAGNVWRNGVHLFGPPERDAETGGEALRFHEEVMGEPLPPDRDIADTLKFSGVRALCVRVVGMVHGGYEDCIDINNRCSRLAVEVPHGLRAAGRYVATIKGGSRDIEITGMIVQHGSVCDVDLGNWSDQSQDRTERVWLDLWTAAARPVTYRRLNATTPRLRGNPPNYRRLWSVPGELRRAFLATFALLKRLRLA